MLGNSFSILHILSPPKERVLSQCHLFFHTPICDSGDTHKLAQYSRWLPMEAKEHFQYWAIHITLKFVSSSICMLANSLEVLGEAVFSVSSTLNAFLTISVLSVPFQLILSQYISSLLAFPPFFLYLSCILQSTPSACLYYPQQYYFLSSCPADTKKDEYQTSTKLYPVIPDLLSPVAH